MFLEYQDNLQKEYYARMLEAMGSLSRLFSENKEPYLAYRTTENLFCKAFQANNLSRSDVSVDASKNSIGFGIKTFLNKNGNTMQKIAEFNHEHNNFNNLSPSQKILKIAKIRNERIETTKRIFGLESLIYHCITRESGKILVYEENMDNILIEKISNVDVKGNGIYFSDGNAEYKFYLSKSTLYKRFHTSDVLLDIPVKILDDPFATIEDLVFRPITKLAIASIKNQKHIFLPLYSSKSGKQIPERSGLNQWNASGRPRDYNEIYIPIPSWIHRAYEGFFPPRDKSFNLILPNKKVLSAKICQDNSKALMSNPNSALGKWLLRDVLNLEEGELLTYEKLARIGLDSVVIYKIDDNNFDINFTRIGAYERFKDEVLGN